jgi:hypothetical protein
MPDWNQDIKDVNDAVCKYGRLHTLYTIIKNAEDSQLKIKTEDEKMVYLKKAISFLFSPITKLVIHTSSTKRR